MLWTVNFIIFTLIDDVMTFIDQMTIGCYNAHIMSYMAYKVLVIKTHLYLFRISVDNSQELFEANATTLAVQQMKTLIQQLLRDNSVVNSFTTFVVCLLFFFFLMLFSCIFLFHFEHPPI